MLTKAEALQLVRQQFPSDCDVMDDRTIERPNGWLFFFQSKSFIETRDPLNALLGSGGILVEKSGGRCLEFGSGKSPDLNLKIYEAGYLDYDDYDLVISAISDPEQTLVFLLQLGISFVKPEFAHGETWRIPTLYSADRLRERLLRLPCRFNLGRLHSKPR